MKLLLSLSSLALAWTPAHADPGQTQAPGFLVTPDTTLERPEQTGREAHTNHVIFMSRQGFSGSGAASGPAGETPRSIASAYSLSPSGRGTIVIVSAFHYPTAENDLNVFSRQFGLPACTSGNGCFSVVPASGRKPTAYCDPARGPARPDTAGCAARPPENCGWAQEAAAGIQWAHAMAPTARIVLVEATSNGFPDLLKAVDMGTALITANGGSGELSMSWGGSEFAGQTSHDSRFANPNVVYFAASGSVGGKTVYPGVSPNVVSVGGTTIHRDGRGGFAGESAWNGSGGGPSQYGGRPSCRNPIASLVGPKRGTPDVSFNADPASGFAVFDSTSCNGSSGWMVVGGTGVAAAALAGIVNSAHAASDSKSSSASPSGSLGELDRIYGRLNTRHFRDIVAGSAGRYNATQGWDFASGAGSPLASPER